MRPVRVFLIVRLFENLFLHIVAVDTFIASVILQIGFDLGASLAQRIYRKSPPSDESLPQYRLLRGR
jgi:hypothetical protein